MADHNVLGNRGEDEAVLFLESRGHRILERNWRLHGYEIDIISEDSEFTVFTEVKTRSSADWGNPEEAIGKLRMRRLINAASHYLKMNKIDRPARFDIVSIIWSNEKIEIEYFEDAFMAFL